MGRWSRATQHAAEVLEAIQLMETGTSPEAKASRVEVPAKGQPEDPIKEGKAVMETPLITAVRVHLLMSIVAAALAVTRIIAAEAVHP